MNSLTQLLTSNYGRILRGVLGIVAAYIAVLYLDGSGKVLVIVVASILFVGALLDLCGLGMITNKNAFGSKIRRHNNKKETLSTTMILLVAGIAALGLLIFLVNRDSADTTTQEVTSTISDVSILPDDTDEDAVKQNLKSQDDMLLYLIEEEKLAHDVYTVMYQLYGAKVFGNILNSEETHQGRVLTLLEGRNIDDPRSTELGVFINSDLQNLYDSLVAQGKQSEIEAYKVGVIIEEKDIADITNQLATATESDVVSVLEALRNGSENHLRSFNRQLGKY